MEPDYLEDWEVSRLDCLCPDQAADLAGFLLWSIHLTPEVVTTFFARATFQEIDEFMRQAEPLVAILRKRQPPEPF